MATYILTVESVANCTGSRSGPRITAAEIAKTATSCQLFRNAAYLGIAKTATSIIHQTYKGKIVKTVTQNILHTTRMPLNRMLNIKSMTTHLRVVKAVPDVCEQKNMFVTPDFNVFDAINIYKMIKTFSYLSISSSSISFHQQIPTLGNPWSPAFMVVDKTKLFGD